MSEEQAKRQLRVMLRSLTPGSILHLLGEVFEKSAENARQDGDSLGYGQCKRVSHTLFVVGLGVDAALPR